MIAAALIARSISHTEIAHAPWTSGLAADLAAACDDWIDAGIVVEFWGEREGRAWRVHLERADVDVTDAQIRELRAEAADEADLDQVAICDHALGIEPTAPPYVVRDDGRLWLADYAPTFSRDEARAECARAIRRGRP